MPVTLKRAYPKPDPPTHLNIDVVTLDQAFDKIDVDVDALFTGLAGKAPTAHAHAMADVTGLAAALAAKQDAGGAAALTLAGLADVVGMAAAPDGYVVVRNRAGGGFTPGSPVAILGAHTHTIDQVLGLSAALAAAVTQGDITAAIAAQVLAATLAQWYAATPGVYLTPAAAWAAAAEVTLGYSASIALNFGALSNAKITLSGNLLLQAPLNQRSGQSGCVRLIQDATGNRLISYDAVFKWTGGAPPIASTAANTADFLYYYVPQPGLVHASFNKAVGP